MDATTINQGTVYVVDDDQSVLKATTRLLRSAGLEVDAFDSPLAFLDLCSPDMSGCLVLDLKMPGLDGLALQQTLIARGCKLPVVFLSGHGDIPTSVRAVKLGAADFLTKPAEASTLLAAIELALRQNAEDRRLHANAASERRRYESLTPREREVLLLVVKGMLNKQIAAAIGTVEKTVKVHRARVMQKMQVRFVADLVRMCERNGWTKV